MALSRVLAVTFTVCALSGCGGYESGSKSDLGDLSSKAPVADENPGATPDNPDPVPKEPDPKPKEPDPVPKEPDPVPKEPDPVPKEPDPESETAAAYSCLIGAADVIDVSGFHDRKYEVDSAKGRAFDARKAEFLIKYESHGMIALKGSISDTGMCWAGGYTKSEQPWDASWDTHKATDGNQPTRNSSIIALDSYGSTITGMHFFNIHDGPRTSNGTNWTVQHVWGEYVRDDALENDHMHSGRLYDSLFDGTYAGISSRPSSSSEDEDSGVGNVITLDKVLIRTLPMPYPYKWDDKKGIINESGAIFDGSGMPFGHGKWFKYYDEDNDNGDRDTKGVHFVIKNSVFAGSHGNVGPEKFNFPAPKLVDQCENVTIAWLGDEPFSGHSSIADVSKKFPNCITLIEGQTARDFWKAKVMDWHKRHPDVGSGRKPTRPGELIFPFKF